MNSDGNHTEPSPVLGDHTTSRHHMLYNTTSPDIMSMNATTDNDGDGDSSQLTDTPYKLDPHIRLHIGKLEVVRT